MNTNKVLIILGEPKSIFIEILFKYIKSKQFKKFKQHIILIGSKKLVETQISKLNYKIKLNIIKNTNHSTKGLINIINVNYKFSKVFSKVNSGSNLYIKSCFEKGLEILKNNKKICLFNGPVSKEHFLKKKYLGITEYLAKKTKTKNPIMLIYNKKLSVSPITTHTPLKNVSKNISKKK